MEPIGLGVLQRAFSVLARGWHLFSYLENKPVMLQNYFKIALRSLLNRRGYTFINVLGLSTGLSCALLIFFWVQDELGTDQHIPDAEQVFRITSKVVLPDDSWMQSVTAAPLGESLKENFEEIIGSARMDSNDAIVEIEGEKSKIDNIWLTDPDALDLFGFDLLLGNAATCLSDPYKVVLTQRQAEQFFGDQNPLGTTLKIFAYDPEGEGMDYEVTGVIANPPGNSHLKINMLASFSTYFKARPSAAQDWFDNSLYTYIKLGKNTNPDILESKLPLLIEEKMGEQMEQYDMHYTYFLQNIRDVHFGKGILYDVWGRGSVENIWIIGIIGAFILVLAGINYINLAMAFSMDRAKEVGVRKVMGAQRGQLIRQHLVETFVLVLLSVALAGVIVELAEPYFKQLSGKSHFDFTWKIILSYLSVLAFVLTLLAGFFPALALSLTPAVFALKKQVAGAHKQFFWKVLVAFQFGVTMAILLGVLVVHKQLNFISNKPLGYNKNNIMVLRVNGSREVINGYQAFKNDLFMLPEIKNVSTSRSMIVGGLGNGNAQTLDDKTMVQKVYRLRVDHSFMETFGVELKAGRGFEETIGSDSAEAFILNETAIHGFEWKTAEEAVGQRIHFSGRDGTVIGVVKNFHFNSLKHEVGPVALYLNQGGFSRISIKGGPGADIAEKVSTLWKQHFSNSLLDYSFQEEALSKQYTWETKFYAIFKVFSVLSLVIACLGLYGLVGFAVSKRQKEIGIRRVLGASRKNIIGMIAKHYLLLILLAAMVALPLGYLGMQVWLREFVYKIDFGFGSVCMLVAGVLLLSLGIIFSQIHRHTIKNPTDILNE